MSFPVKKLLKLLKVKSVNGNLPSTVSGISQDSRRVKSGYIFAARSGENYSVSKFAGAAANAGAVMILTDGTGYIQTELPTIIVSNFHTALVDASKLIYNDPSSRLKLIGITGTDGKTSTAHIIQSILMSAGYHCGMLGTIGYDTISNWNEASLTTPDIDEISELLDEMTHSGSSNEPIWAVMEVSSHALELGRINGLSFSAAGITNLNSEHMDFHLTLDNYAQTKAKLFSLLNDDIPGVINISANMSDVMIEACTGKAVSYGLSSSGADYQLNTLSHALTGGAFHLEGSSEQIDLQTELIGEYQGENIALASAILLELGIGSKDIIKGVKALSNVPGRMERVVCGQPFTVMVDYAHTAQALENSIRTIKQLCNAKLISVFGCGGDRDRTKRSEMGRVVAETADTLIVTNDNPRTEDPLQIIDDILTGIKPEDLHRVLIEPERDLAIKLAIKVSEDGDVLIISGKGAETYQLIGDIKHPFDDREVARKALSQAGWAK